MILMYIYSCHNFLKNNSSKERLDIETKVCVGTYKMHFVNAWLWYTYFIASPLKDNMIELLAVMRELHELLWIQGKELHVKGGHVWLNSLLKGKKCMEHDCEISSIFVMNSTHSGGKWEVKILGFHHMFSINGKATWFDYGCSSGRS